MINKETVVCISLAEKPGNLGATVFNTAFQELSMNYIYKPFLVQSEDLRNAILGIKALGIRGCGVSMPHKVVVMQYLDEIDAVAKEIGAVNTIVNHGGRLTGYNTDFEGVRLITAGDDYSVKGKSILIAGAGGAARAVIQAVRVNGASDISLTNHNNEKGKELAELFHIKYVSWEKRDTQEGGLLVNATPVGMRPDDKPIFEDHTISNFEAVLDVVVSQEDTAFIKKAKEYDKIAFPGIKMSVLQSMAQFKLYTGLDISQEIVEKSIRTFLRTN